MPLIYKNSMLSDLLFAISVASAFNQKSRYLFNFNQLSLFD